ncbi:Uncharacterized protein dnm_065860 [Desulfonema magnum]|uniref:Uncharacterized protein n=1 Tax=Desulfonema magnum TaxID=45655 RepID=A0A975GR38_9BACT|nr:Uncharacterized protein dnm_065860 [Desulfonema magnum]
MGTYADIIFLQEGAWERVTKIMTSRSQRRHKIFRVFSWQSGIKT